MKRCINCGLPEVKNRIIIDDQGICNVCKSSSSNDLLNNLVDEQRINLLKKRVFKRRNDILKYDSAVAMSGGKDSIATLYIAKKLGLKPLAIMIDNGFLINEMIQNAHKVCSELNVDLVIHKSELIPNIFRILLKENMNIYFCRVCHLLLDVEIKNICLDNNIHLLLSGYSDGQNYLNQPELFSIFQETDRNTIKILKKYEKFAYLTELFNNPQKYVFNKYSSIDSISPFKYINYDKQKIKQLIVKKFDFVQPKNSWPKGSSNCEFNFVSQYLARKYFGYSQHETELSSMVRNGQIDREEAIDILNTPIPQVTLKKVLDKIHISKEYINKLVQRDDSYGQKE